MKLRIKDNSLRFRLLRSEVDALAESGRIEAHTFFGVESETDRFSYVLEYSSQPLKIQALRCGNEIRVSVPAAQVIEWARGESVGIYGEQPVHGGQILVIAIEKDFACVDGSDADNLDTFDHPNGSAC